MLETNNNDVRLSAKRYYPQHRPQNYSGLLDSWDEHAVKNNAYSYIISQRSSSGRHPLFYLLKANRVSVRVIRTRNSIRSTRRFSSYKRCVSITQFSIDNIFSRHVFVFFSTSFSTYFYCDVKKKMTRDLNIKNRMLSN